MFKKHQKGFTLTELIICLFGIAAFAGACFAFYAAVHFIIKFW